MIAVTTEQYADMRGIVPGAVRKAIKLGHKMDGVDKLKKFGKSHQIWVSEGFYRRNKKLIKKVA